MTTTQPKILSIAGKAEQSLGYVVSAERKMYDGQYGPEISLGLGNSPIGAAPELRTILQQRDPFHELQNYPKDALHKKTAQVLIEGIGLQGVEPESVIFSGNGSYAAGDEIVRFLALQHNGFNKVMVPAYSFPNVSQWSARHDIPYEPIVTEELNPLASQQRILEMNDADLKNVVVYVDYPNNPFGVYDAQLTRRVVDKVTKAGGIPFVDLAFGETMGREFKDMMQYVYDRDGVSMSSLSKTQGLPDLRVGYALLPKRFINDGYSGDQRLVFGLHHEGEGVLQFLFSKETDNQPTLAERHAQRVSTYNRQTNEQFYAALGGVGLLVAPTSLETQIQVVMSNYPDLYQRLRRVGIVTESLADYAITLGARADLGYKDSAVRMLTPEPSQMDEVINRISIALAD